MLKLTKYEIRKNIVNPIIILAAYLIIEFYFLASVWAGNNNNIAISLILLVLVGSFSVFFVMAIGINTYSKELNSNSGYLTFMTPVSNFKIITSKLFATFIVGMFFCIILAIFAYVDLLILNSKVEEIEIVTRFLEMGLEAFGISTSTLVVNLVTAIIDFLVGFYAVVITAYFAITLSSTVFKNKKFKGVVSFLIFILIIYVISWVLGFVPGYTDSTDIVKMSVANVFIGIAIHMVFGIIETIGVTILLNKKVSL